MAGKDARAMPKRYASIYPSSPLLASSGLTRPEAADLMTVAWFQAAPDRMPEEVFGEHHVLLNLNPEPHRVQNRRDGVLHDFTYRQHEIVVTPAGMRSGWRWFATSDVIVVTLDPAKVAGFAERELGLLLTDRQLADLRVFHDPDLCRAGEMIRDTLETNDLASAVMFESLARVFLVKLLQRYGTSHAESAELSARFTARHFRRVIDYIRTHLDDSVTLDDLAREAAMSPSHFSRVFRQTLGKTPMQYVLNYRIEQAARMMADPARPLGDIAMACGFADQAHFSRSFKQVMGEAPRAWRAKLTG